MTPKVKPKMVIAYFYSDFIYKNAVPHLFLPHLIVLSICLVIFCSTTLQAGTLSLPAYVAQVLKSSNEAYLIQSDISLSDISKEIAEQRFEFEWSPSSQTSVSEGRNNVSMGVEGKRKTTWGPEFTVGLNRSFDGYDVTKSYVEVNLGLFRAWGQRYIRSPLTLAEFQHNKSLLQAVKSEQELIFTAIKSYYQRGESRLLLKQSRESVQRAALNLEVATSRHKLGLADKVDVYRAELSLLDRRESFKRQQRALDRSKRTFDDLLGPVPVDVPANDLSEQGSLPEKVTSSAHQLSPEQSHSSGKSLVSQNLAEPLLVSIKSLYPPAWEDRIFALNIDWQIHLIDQKTVAQNLYVASKNTLPDLQLFMAADNQHFQNPALKEDFDWTVGLRVSSSFSLSQERALYNQERIRYQQLTRQSSQLQKDIIAQTRDSIDDYESISQRVNISKTKLAQAKKALELTSLRFKRGLSSNLDQIETQQSLNQAEIDVVRQGIEQSLQAVNIALTMGILTPEWLNEALTNRSSNLLN